MALQPLVLPNADVAFDPDFLAPESAVAYLRKLETTIAWR